MLWWLLFGLKIFITNPNYTFCIDIMLALKMVFFNLSCFDCYRTLNFLLLHEYLNGRTSLKDHALKDTTHLNLIKS